MSKTRTETDSFGPLEVSSDKYWGAQTQRSLGNFKIGGETMPSPLVRALGIVKYCAARTNIAFDNIDKKLGDMIAAAALEVTEGKLGDNFPLVVWQTGSGTRLWLDRQLTRLQIDHSTINGYGQEVYTHSHVGQAIHNGQADVGLGVQAVAVQMALDYIPLFEERFDLLVSYEYLNDPRLQPIFDLLQSSQLRQAINHLAGYDATRTGDMVIVEG